MRKRLWTLCFGLILAASAARAEFAAQYNFQDFTQTRQAVKAVYLTPLWNVTVNNTTNIAVGQRQSKQTDSAGSLVVSNMIYGAYLVEFIGPTRTNRFTNCFDSSISPGSLVNAADYICVGTNATDTSGYAYTQAQSNQRFSTNVVPSVVGYVATAVDTLGHYDWELSGGSGGGITLAQGTNIVDGSGGVIATNGSHTTFKFSSTGTNVINSLAATAATAATNAMGVSSQLAAFAPTNQFDVALAALNATNGIGLSSGLSAFRPTNSFASSNIATTSLNGIARPDGSTITITAGGVMTAVTGGSGTVTSVGLAGPADLTISGSPVTTSGTLTFSRTANALADYGGQNLSNLNSIVVGAGSMTNTSVTASTMLKADSNKKMVSATAGSDYVAPSSTLTIAGTANQVNSSAGAQDLSANRTWTLSLSSTLIAPGTLNVTSDQTNQATLSVLGRQTNFSDIYAKGAVVITGGQTNSTLTANSMAVLDANKKWTSIAPAAGVPTNDAAGNWGFAQLLDASQLKSNQFVYTGPNDTNLYSTLDAQKAGGGWTNYVFYTHEGTTTNITATFNGTLQTFTCTNGPSIGQNYFIHYAGANGSISYRFSGSSYNNLTFDYQPKWLTGSNSVITNGVLTLTSYGGTNATQIEAAMRENQ